MRVALMQPYLFPYKGYFDLIASVDKFVLYDDAKYTKGGWINRNYFPELFTFRLKKHSDYAKINECFFFDIEDDKQRFVKSTGIQSPYLDLLDQNLSVAENCERTLKAMCSDRGITTPFYRSSDIPHGKFIKGILDVVHTLGGDTYVNAPGGKTLYTQDMFGDITLEFIETTTGPSLLCEGI